MFLLKQVSISVGDNFDHLIAYSIACTLENDVGCAMGHEEFKFGSLHEVIKGDVLDCLGQGKGGFEQGKKKLHMSIESSLERGKAWGKVALKEAKE